MTTNPDREGEEIVCETKMEISVFINQGGTITIKQLDAMGNEPSLICVHKNDVTALVRALNKLKRWP